MIENFTIAFSNGGHYKGYITKMVGSIILSAIIISSTTGLYKIEGVLSLILLAMILYVISLTMSNENLSNDLPSSLYPTIPHTGLDGISLNNYVAGMDMRKNFL
jgi:hypothetical protein